jgi:hypothetical protein
MQPVSKVSSRPLKASTRNAYPRPQNGAANPYQRSFNTQRRQSQKPTTHNKPALDDKLSQEEVVEEPTIKKVKIVEPVPEPEVPQLPEIIVKESSQPALVKNNADIAKMKLDNMFNRNAKKKLVRPVTTTIDNYNDIEKLMSQYAGTPLLNKSDL